MAGASSVWSALRNPFAWAIVALVMSIAALGLAGAAFRNAGNATEAAKAIPRQPVPADTTTPEATVSPTEEPSSDPAPTTPMDDPSGPVSTELPVPGASYTLFKEDIKIRVPGGSTRYLDLDQPLVNADTSQLDVSYSGYSSSSPTLEFSTSNVAEGKSASVTPDECAQNIQLSPADSEVKLSQDLVLCAVTNGIGAVNQPARAKMARIIVNSVSKDNSLDLTITTWEIPR